MSFPDAFTVFRSAAVTVRVEPPDLVIVEGLSGGTLRFSRSQVRKCRPMLVTYYREQYDRAYVPPNDGEILIWFHVEGGQDGQLGPFPHAEGMGIAEAINLARKELLFAVPELSLHIAADGASLVIAYGRRMSVPIPTAELVELAVRDDERLDAHHRFAGAPAPADAPRWIVLVLARGKPHLIGPFSAPDAATIARAFRTWRAEHPIDREPLEVSESDLLADPTRFHLRRIRVTGAWSHFFEGSSFARAWLRVPEGGTYPRGNHRARVVGTWIYPDAKAEHGYGHMGMSPGLLTAETIEIVAA
jgi:hypothetical protein